jgi:hypothetical protein
LLATVVVLTTSALAGHFPFATAPWIHWDAYEYLDISRHGYTLYPCFVGRLLSSCGNSGWFPGYPWVVRAVAWLGLDHAAVAVAVSWFFGLATVVLLWAAFFKRVSSAAIVAVLFVAFAPGLVYDYAVFPVSMVAFFTVLYFLLLSRERWLWAGAVGCVVVLTYPVGLAAPVGVGLALLLIYRRVSWRERIRRIALSVVPPFAALVLVPVVQEHETGHWDAFFLAQSNYGHALIDPFRRVLHAVGLLARFRLFTVANAPYAQTLLVAFAIVSILVALALRRPRPEPFQLMLAIWMLLAWLIPQAYYDGSPYRGENALIPIAILIATLPRVLAAVIIVGLVTVAIPMEVLFLRNTLI